MARSDRSAGAIVVDPIVIPDLKPLLAKRASNPDIADVAMKRYPARNPNSPFASREDIARSPGHGEEHFAEQSQSMGRAEAVTDLAKWGEYLQAREQLVINISKVMADNVQTCGILRAVPFEECCA